MEKPRFSWPDFDDRDLAIIAGSVVAVVSLLTMNDPGAETIVLAIVTGIFGLAGSKAKKQ